MDTVKVGRTELLEAIKANMAGHRAAFEAAQEVYRERMIAELDTMLADAKAGRSIRRAVSMPEPEDHTNDYASIVKMLEMSVDDVIELDEESFQQFVMDDWYWKSSFAHSTLAYAASNKAYVAKVGLRKS